MRCRIRLRGQWLQFRNNMHDVIIIGAGPAGLSTAFWCDELGLDALVLEQAEQIGGQLHRVYNPIENYLGLKTSNGKELLDRFATGVESAEFDLWTQTSITAVDLRAKRVSLASGETLQSIALVLATGVQAERAWRTWRKRVCWKRDDRIRCPRPAALCW